MPATAAWILVLTLVDPSRPQFVEFTSKDNCEATRTLVIERYADAKKAVYLVYPRDGAPPFLPPDSPPYKHAAVNATCKPK